MGAQHGVEHQHQPAGFLTGVAARRARRQPAKAAGALAAEQQTECLLGGQPPSPRQFQRVRQLLVGGVDVLNLGIHRQIALGREGQDRPHQQGQRGIVHRVVGPLGGQLPPARRRDAERGGQFGQVKAQPLLQQQQVPPQDRAVAEIEGQGRAGFRGGIGIHGGAVGSGGGRGKGKPPPMGVPGVFAYFALK